jgi:putative endonuclease
MSPVLDTPHFVYVLWSETGRRFYIGISQNPEVREEQHNSGSFKSWSKRYRPWSIVFKEEHPDYTSARKREIELKAQKGGRGFFIKTGLDPSRFDRQPGHAGS